MSRGGAQTQSRGGGGSHTPAPRWRNDPRSKLDVRNTGAHPFASDDLQGLKSPPTPDGDQLPPGIVWCPLLKMAAIIRAIDGTWGPRLCFFAYPSRSERIFSFLYFSLWGPCFPFFSILYEMVFRDIFFCPFFFLSVPGFLHKMAIHKCRRHGCLKLFAGILEALSLCQMLKPFIYYLTLEMRARRRVSYIDESPSTETSDSFLF